MSKTLWPIIALLSFLAADIALAQDTRSLSGTLRLDVGPSDNDRNIEITVRNHLFIVIPPNFTILRPILSSESVIVQLAEGSSQVSYSIDNIITDPVDYSISVRCLGCAIDIPNQFYTPNGNTFGLGLTAFIDPQGLPDTLDLTAITRAKIDGEIVLNEVSDRDLQFELTVFSSENADDILSTISPIILASGQESVSYSIKGLNRSIAPAQYRVSGFRRCLCQAMVQTIGWFFRF